MHILHDEIVQTIEFAGIIHLYDMRVGDGGRRLGLAVEPLYELIAMGALRQLGVHDLDGDGALQTLVHGLIHRGHAAFGDFADDPIAAFDDLPFGCV